MFSLRRCRRHYYNLKKDNVWGSMQSMTKERRSAALDVLDDVQKRRPPWQYEGNEAGLISERERREGSHQFGLTSDPRFQG